MNSEKNETIGKVNINYDYYRGEDLYSEGANEDLLLEYVKKYDASMYEEVILSARSWSVMYHLMHTRENIVGLFDIRKDQNVLEIGAGCGAVTGILCSMAKDVTCIELSRKRSLINAYRHRDADNLSILVGNFEDIEPDIEEKYDYITLIGVLEYAESYLSGNDPYTGMLKRIQRHLKPGGKLLIAIENKYGLKYIAGCKEDHTGLFYEGIEGYTRTDGVKTFSKKGLQMLMEKAGLSARFYYPYPDYKLCHSIYSDKWLPGQGELDNNLRNFDADRVVCFDEEKAFNELIEEGRFAEFSNSFLIVATPDDNIGEYPLYAKYSDERNEAYRIATVITEDETGKRRVYKKALSLGANSHVEKMLKDHEQLNGIFKDSGFIPNSCREDDKISRADGDRCLKKLSFEYLDGITMEKYLDELSDEERYDEMYRLIQRYGDILKNAAKESYTNTEENDRRFSEIFGGIYTGDDKCFGISDIDLIFENIVFERDNTDSPDHIDLTKWNILDYEWTFDLKIPLRFILYRSLYYYLRDREETGFTDYLKLGDIDLYREMGISDEEKEFIFPGFEQSFQLYIKRNTVSFELLHEVMPFATLKLDRVVEKNLRARNLKNPEVFINKKSGAGFVPGDFINVLGEYDEERDLVTLSIDVSDDMKEIRIDPLETECMLKIVSAGIYTGNNDDIESRQYIPIENILTNGHVISDKVFLYDHADPQIIITDIPKEACKAVIEYMVSPTDEMVCTELSDMFEIIKENEDKRRYLGSLVKRGINKLNRMFKREKEENAATVYPGCRKNKGFLDGYF
ncbi:MAG: class I SAM-dependent methyltransferase [Lachnospiraceae bacterium]|nr:class I SAM-dependent methyltransferase [Lachnospiraceae bacterium]